MNGLMKKSIVALVAGSALVTAAAPAEAQRWHGGGGFNRGYHGGGYGYRGGGYRGGYYRGGGAGVAIGAGLLGLGVGAAIASSNRPYYGGGGYYDGGYGGGYYGGPAYYAGDCYTRRVWDPYLGRPVRVRYCD